MTEPGAAETALPVVGEASSVSQRSPGRSLLPFGGIAINLAAVVTHSRLPPG
jgi:hypothetical protein